MNKHTQIYSIYMQRHYALLSWTTRCVGRGGPWGKWDIYVVTPHLHFIAVSNIYKDVQCKEKSNAFMVFNWDLSAKNSCICS